MSEQSKNLAAIESVAVIFDQNDTEFALQSVDICGFRYKERSTVLPRVEEGGKLEITDESTATFIRNCLLRRAELATGIITAHHLSFERVHEYQLPQPSIEQQQRIRESIERSRAIYATAHLLALIIDASLEK